MRQLFVRSLDVRRLCREASTAHTFIGLPVILETRRLCKQCFLPAWAMEPLLLAALHRVQAAECGVFTAYFAGKPVFLDISIKVKKGWREDEASVSKFGY